MWRDIRQYLLALWRHWAGLLAGPAATVALLIWQVFAQTSITPWVFWVVALTGVPVAGFLAWRDARPLDALVPVPLDVQVIPLWFRVSLNLQVPDVAVFVQVINYRNRELKASEVTATYLQVDRGPPMENIPAGEYRIPARQSSEVRCHRALNDAETTVFRGLVWSDEISANLSVRLRGAAGRKVIAIDGTGSSVRGIVAGLPSHPLVKQAP